MSSIYFFCRSEFVFLVFSLTLPVTLYSIVNQICMYFGNSLIEIEFIYTTCTIKFTVHVHCFSNLYIYRNVPQWPHSEHLHYPQRNPHLLSSLSPPSALSSLKLPTNLLSVSIDFFCIYSFASCGHFIQMQWEVHRASLLTNRAGQEWWNEFQGRLLFSWVSFCRKPIAVLRL